ncbi:MAG: hypothetical protein WA743_01215, partial [Pseudolabrys sp.]
SLAELVAVVIVISMLDDHNFPVVVMAVPIMVVIAVSLDNHSIFGTGRSHRQSERDRSKCCNRQSNVAH